MSACLASSAYALANDWHLALEHAIHRLQRIDGANLGLIYFSDRFNGVSAALIERLRAATGVNDWVGASGIGVLGAGEAELDAPAISLMLFRLPADSFRVFSGRNPLPRDFAAYGALIHGDPATPDMSDLILDMASKVRSDNVCGGLASGHSKTLQIANAPLNGGVSGVAFDERIRLVTGLSQGCVALPGSWRVTGVEEAVITELDGRPALKVFREAIGPALGADLRRATRNLQVGLCAEPGVQRAFAVRHITDFNLRQGSFAINDQVSEGQHLLFVKQDAESAASDFRQMLLGLRQACPEPPVAGIYISAAGRGAALFERDDSEVAMIGEVFDQLPLCGFFASGEIANCRLQGLTGALTLIF
ncbi:FIST signal transduction protein [Uliginosibacterium sediminicola]|uniref:FIST N-terminal domain-containing protein n=1 Tax=Uliginosibacterium sediminicola TaxID=2024550 RepID=A0ABU9Z3F6_9RHOO